MGWVSAVGADPLIEGNEISGAATGIWIAGGANPVISGNRIHGNDIGIAVRSSDATFSENTICDNEQNLQVPEGIEAPGIDATNSICEDAMAG